MNNDEIINIDFEELRGISRTVAELHWLLLILVLLFLAFGGTTEDNESAVSAALFVYGAFVLGFRYTNFGRRESRWKVAVETCGMIAFSTWVLRYTGGLSSPLLNLYLLPVITSGLTLGKATTFILTALIAACHILLGGPESFGELFRLSYIGMLAVQIAPVLLVAYVTTMFSVDIRYGVSKAKLLSETDELTGLPNTRGFNAVAARAFAQSRRYGRPVSLLMLDSDNLKGVNDTQGHEAGNQLLRNLADAVRHELRGTDVPARYGGDEFIALLPETDGKAATDVAERIRRAVEARPLLSGDQYVRCTVSIGVASCPPDGESLTELVSRADRALYAAKGNGRNLVRRFGDRDAQSSQ